MTESTFEVARKLALATAAVVCIAPTTVAVEQTSVGTKRLGTSSSAGSRNAMEVSSARTGALTADTVTPYFENPPVDRETTTRELLIAELRAWKFFTANWDGEGASAPSLTALQKAAAFVCDMSTSDPMPEPMLHADGSAGLYWNDDERYGDIKFLEDGRVAYYIEKAGSKHKGVVNHDDITLHAVLDSILFALPASIAPTQTLGQAPTFA